MAFLIFIWRPSRDAVAALHREGRRLRALMAEQWTSVRAEAIRLKEERRLFEDARIMADLVNDQVCFSCIFHFEYLASFIK